MSAPAPGQPAAKTALTDLDNVGWVQEKQEVSETAAYWRARGMIPPPETELEQ